MAGPGVPPGAMSVHGGRPGASLVKTPLHQAQGTGTRPFPLPPQDAAQFAPQPAVEFLEYPFGLRQPEVLDPAAQQWGEGLDGAPDGPAAPLPKQVLQLVPQPCLRIPVMAIGYSSRRRS